MALDSDAWGSARSGGGRCIRISALPDELRQRILTHLPLKDAIRTGALARGWRGLWKTRWSHRSSVKIHLRSRDAPRRELDALGREPRPRRRLDRFSLIVDTCKLRCYELQRFLAYAAECRVEDLHVETRKSTVEDRLSIHLPRSSPLLARLSLRRIGVSNLYYKGAQPFHALEVIVLHSVSIAQSSFKKMLALCPSLRTLDLRGCDSDCFFYSDKSLVWPANLTTITVADCDGLATLDLVRVPSLRSFRYSGSFRDAPFSLPRDVMLADLYICFDESILGSRRVQLFKRSLPSDLSGLTVFTICSNALQVVSSLSDDGATCQSPKLSIFHNLREVQLLMLQVEVADIANIYVFLKTFQCPNLERLFVQLPESNYEPVEGSHDEVGEEPMEAGLDNLKIVKFMNFNWRRTEVQLVNFLLKKASSLHKLLLVSPNVAPQDMLGVQKADLLLLEEALANGKIMLSESDDAATQPYHSEVFIKY
ncbi:hypothetical protein ACP70R_043986 [Stipagrostis hirtigluma subsp. patula]